MKEITPNQALSDLSLETFRLTARLNVVADRLSREVGLSSARWQVLGAILEAEGEAISVAEIARRMGLQRQSVQRTADTLNELGFLAYQPNPRHRRAKLATITPQGRKTMAKLHQRREQWANSIASQLHTDNLRQATDTLKQLRTVLDMDT